MNGELNDLTYNNIGTTFNNKPDNLKLGDELNAPAVYSVDKINKRAKIIKRVTVASGIALLATAASIRAGTLISNGFVLNPPTINNDTYQVKEGVFSYKFEITNQKGYLTYYYIDVNKENVVKEECTTTGVYEGTFDKYSENDSCKFYIEFTNKLDYKKTIKRISFTKGGIK